MLLFTLLCILAYILGSIPTALILGKIFFKKDIRQLGSGNSGATNAFRVFGKPTALIVLTFDILKGFIAVSLSPNSDIQLFLGLSVLVGHIYPIFSKFKGGKGVATTFGCFLAINPFFLIIPLCVYIGTLYIWRISSISSIFATLSFVFSGIIFTSQLGACLLIIFTCAIILHTHRENVERIISGKENKLF